MMLYLVCTSYLIGRHTQTFMSPVSLILHVGYGIQFIISSLQSISYARNHVDFSTEGISHTSISVASIIFVASKQGMGLIDNRHSSFVLMYMATLH